MRTEDGLRFKAVMATLYNAYSRKNSDKSNSEFWKRLKAAPIERVEQAVEKWVNEQRRFPRVSELRDLCGLNVSLTGPVTPLGRPRDLPPGAREFVLERGYEIPEEFKARYGSYQQHLLCRCAACLKAECPEAPVLVPEWVTLIDGRKVEVGRLLHGVELNAFLVARDDYEFARLAWVHRAVMNKTGQRNDEVTTETQR